MNKWYFDDKLKWLAFDVLDAVTNGDIDAFKKAFSEYSDYLREVSYNDGVNNAVRDYEENL